MTSTKVMYLGILIMLMGFALVSAATQLVMVKALGVFDPTPIAYIASALFVIGSIVGVIGFFRQ